MNSSKLTDLFSIFKGYKLSDISLPRLVLIQKPLFGVIFIELSSGQLTTIDVEKFSIQADSDKRLKGGASTKQSIRMMESNEKQS